jgi:hypothetical protein
MRSLVLLTYLTSLYLQFTFLISHPPSHHLQPSLIFLFLTTIAMTFNTAALYGYPQDIPSSYQVRYEPLPPRRPRAYTKTQDAKARWHHDVQQMPGFHTTSNFQPPILNREHSSMWDDVEVQNDWTMAAREQGMPTCLFAHNVLGQFDGGIQGWCVSCKSNVPLIMSNTLVRTRNTNVSLSTLSEGVARLLTESVHGMNLNQGVVCPLTESVHGMNLLITNEGVACLLTDRKITLHLLSTNQSSVHLLTASDSGVNPLIANESVVLQLTGDTSAICRLDVVVNMDLFLGCFPVRQFVLCLSSLPPQVPDPVLANLNLNL